MSSSESISWLLFIKRELFLNYTNYAPLPSLYVITYLTLITISVIRLRFLGLHSPAVVASLSRPLRLSIWSLSNTLLPSVESPRCTRGHFTSGFLHTHAHTPRHGVAQVRLFHVLIRRVANTLPPGVPERRC